MAGFARARLLAAAAIIGAEAARLAAAWSVQIPPDIKIAASDTVAVISSQVGPSYPNEVKGVRHPVFGGRGTMRPDAPWVLNQYRPFLAPAANTKADAAAEEYAKTVDDIAHSLGFASVP